MPTYLFELCKGDGTTPLGECPTYEVTATDHVEARGKILAQHPGHEVVSWCPKEEDHPSNIAPLPCPFCGKAVDMEDHDTLYPSGIGWSDTDHPPFRTYHNARHVPKEQWCWSMNCPTPAGGCGAEMTGDSREEALKKWNRRA